MSWQVFGGDAHELYLALLKERCERDGLGSSDDVLARQFRLHLHRGIGYLAAPQAIRSIADLIELAIGGGENNTAVSEGGDTKSGSEAGRDQCRLAAKREQNPGDQASCMTASSIGSISPGFGRVPWISAG